MLNEDCTTLKGRTTIVIVSSPLKGEGLGEGEIPLPLTPSRQGREDLRWDSSPSAQNDNKRAQNDSSPFRHCEE